MPRPTVLKAGRMLKLAAALAAVALLLPAAAMARPTIDEAHATAKHNTALAKSVVDWNAQAIKWNAYYREENQILGYEAYGPDDFDSIITSYTTEPCERETQFRALCGYAMTYDDGRTCEGEDDIVVKRNGRMRVVWGWDDEDCG